MAGGDAGGIAGAADLLGEHGGAIEADLQRFYRVHVGDFPWPLTARRLKVLLAHLPADAALWESMRAAATEAARPDPDLVLKQLADRGITIPDELRRR
jgi:hypothetical protein